LNTERQVGQANLDFVGKGAVDAANKGYDMNAFVTGTEQPMSVNTRQPGAGAAAAQGAALPPQSSMMTEPPQTFAPRQLDPLAGKLAGQSFMHELVAQAQAKHDERQAINQE